jgi:serine/threonine protein kinase
LKYPSKTKCQGLEKIPLLKTKYPTQLLVKLSSLSKGYDFDFYSREQMYGQYFVKMSYTAPESELYFMLLMEKVPKISLYEFITLLNKNPTMITAKSYLQIALNLLEALNHIHLKGLIHCDIKPENILIDEALKVRFIDFGLVRKVSGNYDTLRGTQLYLPPIVPHYNTQKSDIVALCFVLLELLGQTNRNYLRSEGELRLDNKNISVNEILLGTKGFSFEEIKTLKQTLKQIFHPTNGNRLDDLAKLITIFKDLLNNHKISDVHPCTLFDKSQVHDIIAYHEKGMPILLADLIEWVTPQQPAEIISIKF